MFRNPFSFNGRIRRLEYGLSQIIYCGWIYGIALAFSFLKILHLPSGSAISKVFLAIVLLPAIWFVVAQGAKRCHDRGNSAWWMFIPFYGIWMLFADGEIGPNEYGENPKGLFYRLGGLYRNGSAASQVKDEVTEPKD